MNDVILNPKDIHHIVSFTLSYCLVLNVAAQPETFTNPELVSPSTTDEDAPNRSAALH